MRRLRRGRAGDALTGLRDHRAFFPDLEGAIDAARRAHSTLTLVVLDIDELSTTNARDGRDEGDRMLRDTARQLRAAVQSSENVYRIGDDEFAAILPGATDWGGFRFARRVREAVLNTGSAPAISGGVAELNDSSDANMMLRHAGLALAEAKRGGRQVLIYSESFLLARQSASRPVQAHQLALAQALARAVDVKDSYTRSHCGTVAETCAAIGERLGLSHDRIDRLRLAGLLHDVGKIGIPDEILQKPGALTAEEMEIMKTHSTLGHSILQAADLQDEAYWILHHHERVDGSGYPGGFKGDDIPLESRIILVADTLEAMTADRPYRQGRPEHEAVLEIERLAGTQFDATCVGALKQVLERPAAARLDDALARVSSGL